jgi:hypothetical protein
MVHTLVILFGDIYIYIYIFIYIYIYIYIHTRAHLLLVFITAGNWYAGGSVWGPHVYGCTLSGYPSHGPWLVSSYETLTFKVLTSILS